jgi:hypothetical protein
LLAEFSMMRVDSSADAHSMTTRPKASPDRPETLSTYSTPTARFPPRSTKTRRTTQFGVSVSLDVANASAIVEPALQKCGIAFGDATLTPGRVKQANRRRSARAPACATRAANSRSLADSGGAGM